MIDLGRFVAKKSYFLPLINGWGQNKGRKFYAPKEDGWYFIDEGMGQRVIHKATPLQVFQELSKKRFLRMYAFGEEAIPINFDNLTQRGYGQTVKVNFMNLQTFEVAKVIQWEDERFYFYEPDSRFQRKTLQTLKERFNKEEDAQGIRGITPEMAYLLILVDLGRQTYREVERLNQFRLSQEEKKKRMEEFKNSFAGILQKTIEDAGGKLIKFAKANKDALLVHWKIKGDEQIIKTTIKPDMRILSAGYCLSGYDRAHSLSSLIQLAKVYKEEDEEGLYITRF